MAARVHPEEDAHAGTLNEVSFQNAEKRSLFTMNHGILASGFVCFI